MKILKSILNVISAIFIIVGLVVSAVFLLRACLIYTSKTEILHKSISPDGRYTAVSFIYIAGGAVGAMWNGVEIVRKGEKLKKKPDSIFILESYQGNELLVSWENNKTLNVTYYPTGKETIEKQLYSKDNIKINYVAMKEK